MSLPHGRPPAVYTVETAARLLGIGRTLAYDLIRRDEFPVGVIRLGRRIVVPSAKLDALLELGDVPVRHRGAADVEEQTT